MLYRTNFEYRSTTRTMPRGTVVRFAGTTPSGLGRFVDAQGNRYVFEPDKVDPVPADELPTIQHLGFTVRAC